MSEPLTPATIAIVKATVPALAPGPERIAA